MHLCFDFVRNRSNLTASAAISRLPPLHYSTSMHLLKAGRIIIYCNVTVQQPARINLLYNSQQELTKATERRRATTVNVTSDKQTIHT